MESILIMVVAFVGYIVAYRTYGRYLARRIFGLDPDRQTPSHELEDRVDSVPPPQPPPASLHPHTWGAWRSTTASQRLPPLLAFGLRPASGPASPAPLRNDLS